MKSRGQGKASKASLVARGLASKSKPPAFKRVQKGPQKAAVKETKPGYSLYTSDSEDQASSVDRGLNRCAALLSNILDNEDKDSTTQSKVTGMVKPVKSTIKRTGPTTHPSTTVKPGKLDTQRTRTFSRKVVIPTARADDKVSPSPSKQLEEKQRTSTAYNDRLVSSTPVLTSEERQRRQQLQRREADLQHELVQLKQRYDLLQRQQDPSHHTEQKLKLQSSMMQELESHQQKGTLQRPATLQGSTETQSAISSRNEQLSNQSSKRTSARRSLDYSGFPVTKTTASDASFDDSQSGGTSDLIRRHDDENPKYNVDDSVTQEVGTPESKKRVRIVSPTRTTSPFVNGEPLISGSQRQNVSNSPDAGLSEATRTRHMSPPSSLPARTSSASARSRDGLQPSSAENQARMIQYLVDELRALLGGTGDLEVDRLLNEIDDAAKLLPYLMEKDKTASTSQDIEQAVQLFKNENAQLRRKLLIAHQKLKEGSLKKNDDKSPRKTDLTFELAACRSVNTVLQKQLTEEKDSKEQILRDRDQLAQNLSDLQDEKRKFLQILSNKGQDQLRLKREWQQDTSKLNVENKKLKADLEAIQLSTEADKKEVNILSLSLKQKDAEIERLKELTRGLQQSLARLLSDIQQFQPNGVLKPGGMLDKAISFEGLDKLLRSEVKQCKCYIQLIFFLRFLATFCFKGRMELSQLSLERSNFDKNRMDLGREIKNSTLVSYQKKIPCYI
ncbi:hypothetical protein ACROYT_G035357 [Oculina patagonica]